LGLSTDKFSVKNFAGGATHTSTVKRAVADLGDLSHDDYSEDMDESVAFSKGLSEKENYEVEKHYNTKPNKYVSSKRDKRGFNTNRSEYTNNSYNNLNFSACVAKPKAYYANPNDKRRSSYMN